MMAWTFSKFYWNFCRLFFSKIMNTISEAQEKSLLEIGLKEMSFKVMEYSAICPTMAATNAAI